MKIGIAMDSFKGSVTSLAAGLAVERGIKRVLPKAQIELCQVSDGGEGSLEAIYGHCGGTWQRLKTVNLMFEPVEVDYLISLIQGEKTAVIESARIIGLHFIQPSESTVDQSSSYGLGQVIKDAAGKGVKRVIVTLGGSGTTDGGLGLLQSLGAELFDEQKKLIGLTNPLRMIASLDIEPALEFCRQSGIQLEIANDVTNVYGGEAGAAFVFGPQKGASASQCQWLNEQLLKVAAYGIETYDIDLQKVSGSGAAGGLGGAFCLLGAKMISGFELMSEVLNLAERLKGTSAIYTGEGSLDGQSAAGKVPAGIAEIGNRYGIPVIALAGRRDQSLGQLEGQLTAAFSIQLEPCSLAEALTKEKTEQGLETVASQSIKLLQASFASVDS
ncbi:glycerate kinase [Vagococcus sp. BWB3-3]|uniref:Glycerate kinase n=1 Tax=Vagococcus allomyrinae TaxID=2794353 RepID=A0A940PBV1_9ENTE|nr:glycerate kinase [Vagococcus allomyrinae]MBP1042114.1 glycerate kinase [Vagococcus allomyrinae]